MDNFLARAIQSVQQSEIAFSKFITANDTGATGGHQAGFHISKQAWSLFFESPGIKGSNKDRIVQITWQDSIQTESRFTYYGIGTRNEYRLTRFGKNFPFLQDENIGDLLIISKKGDGNYDAYVLHSDEEIEQFLVALNISTEDINGIIPQQFEKPSETKLLECFRMFIESLDIEFPATNILAGKARNCFNEAFRISANDVRHNPDKIILNWLGAEFQLFKELESDRYSKRINTHFSSVEELIEVANTILNRRKSRAGKSLEHHLAEIFTTFQLKFASQAITEDNKKPDFLFPNNEAYSNKAFNADKLVVLACKTTCKDRWRQVLNEADRVKTKHLFTLQQGISRNQLDEMYKYGVSLVVPKAYKTSFPPEYKQKIMTLEEFVKHVEAKQV